MYIGTTLHDKAACWAHRGRSEQGQGIGLNDAISLLFFCSEQGQHVSLPMIDKILTEKMQDS
jgi:hypothetical protein